MLKMLPPSLEESPQETKQAAKRLQKLKQDMTHCQEEFRLKKLHEHIKTSQRHDIMGTHIITAGSHRTRDPPVMSYGTFHAASTGMIIQGQTSPEERSLAVPEDLGPVPMDCKDSDSDQDNLVITSIDTADF